MKQNYKIIEEDGLPDLIPTQDADNGSDIFGSFREAKRAVLELNSKKIAYLGKLKDKLEKNKAMLQSLFIKDFGDTEEVGTERVWEQP